jgi:hypothetical protein
MASTPRRVYTSRVTSVPRRKDSPYSDDLPCESPDGLGTYGEVGWLAQNEGQHVRSTGLHLTGDEIISPRGDSRGRDLRD